MEGKADWRSGSLRQEPSMKGGSANRRAASRPERVAASGRKEQR
jgi:hypothetical protein